MSLNFEEIEKWNRLAAKCDCSFFNTYSWWSLWSNDEDLDYYEIQDSNYHAALLLAKRKYAKGLFNTYLSSPAYTYGGIISEKCLPHKYLNKLTEIAQNKRNIYLLNSPSNPNPIYNFSDDFTQIIYASEVGTNFYRNWSKHHLRNLEQSKKYDLIVYSSNNIDDWTKYYKLYQETRARWGSRSSSNYCAQLFEKIYALPKEHRSLWICKLHENILGGIICFKHKKSINYWHGSSSTEYLHLKSNYYLFDYVIKYYFDEGMEIFDFNPSSGYTGVENFKSGFGPRKIKIHSFKKESLIKKLYSKYVKIIEH